MIHGAGSGGQASRRRTGDFRHHLWLHGPEALFAALDFDLFTHIELGADTLARLAEGSGVPENWLLGLIAALKSVGLIVEREDRFANAPATAKFLVAGAPGDFRDYVRLVTALSATKRFGI